MAQTLSEKRRAAALARWSKHTPEQRREENANAIRAAHQAIRERIDPDGCMPPEVYRSALSRYMNEVRQGRAIAS